MEKHLERFVRDNREAFDSYEPSNDLWKRMERELDANQPDKKRLNGKIVHLGGWQKGLKIAASILIVLSLSYLAYQNYAIEIIEEHPAEFALSPTYAKELASYTSTIGDKRGELEILLKEDPDLAQQFDAELKALDENYQSLRAELPKNPNQEDLLKAMVQNLQWQTDLLNQQLHILQKIKESKNEKAKIII